MIWVEALSESFFENSRMVDDELWGTALVDGDGSTNTLVACSCSLLHGSSLLSSLVAGDDCTFEKPEAAFENDHLWLAVSIATVQQTLR